MLVAQGHAEAAQEERGLSCAAQVPKGDAMQCMHHIHIMGPGPERTLDSEAHPVVLSSGPLELLFPPSVTWAPSIFLSLTTLCYFLHLSLNTTISEVALVHIPTMLSGLALQKHLSQGMVTLNRPHPFIASEDG